jgi:hypothetical protein
MYKTISSRKCFCKLFFGEKLEKQNLQQTKDICNNGQERKSFNGKKGHFRSQNGDIVVDTRLKGGKNNHQ